MNMELVCTNDAFEAMQSSKYIVVDHRWVKTEDVSRHLRSQGSWARDMFLGLDEVDQTSIPKEIAHFILQLVEGRSVVEVERDSNNEVVLDVVFAC